GVAAPGFRPAATFLPSTLMLMAALTSRSWVTPQLQVHSRVYSGFGPSLRPHAEQTCEEGKNLPTRLTVRPYRRPLSSSIDTNIDHPASCTLLPMRVRPMAATSRSST